MFLYDESPLNELGRNAAWALAKNAVTVWGDERSEIHARTVNRVSSPRARSPHAVYLFRFSARVCTCVLYMYNLYCVSRQGSLERVDSFLSYILVLFLHSHASQ
jgi:hypothetical protein